MGLGAGWSGSLLERKCLPIWREAEVVLQAANPNPNLNPNPNPNPDPDPNPNPNPNPNPTGGAAGSG